MEKLLKLSIKQLQNVMWAKFGPQGGKVLRHTICDAIYTCFLLSGGKEDRRTGGMYDSRTGGKQDRQIGGQEDRRPGGDILNKNKKNMRY